MIPSLRVVALKILSLGFVALPLAAVDLEIDGSSTVYPITNAIAEQYRTLKPDRKITVKFSGSSAGIRRLIAGEIAIADSSRPIKAKELEDLKTRGFEVLELPVAFDGVTVVCNKENSFIDHLTVEELKKLWQPDKPAMRWSEVRAGWPDEAVKLFGPGKDSGTLDFFTEAIVGKANSTRSDYTASEDDDVIVQGVVANKSSGLGYFGWAYYLENKDLLRAVPIKSESGVTGPSEANILSGTYRPLSRPIFIYINSKMLAENIEIRDFVDFYLRQVHVVAPKVGYVSLGQDMYDLVKDRFVARTLGSAFASAPKGVAIKQILLEATKTAAKHEEKTTAKSEEKPISKVESSVLVKASDPAKTPDVRPVPVQEPAPSMVMIAAPRQQAPMSGMDYRPAIRATPREFRSAVDDLRDSCLDLSRVAMEEATTLVEIERRMRIIQTHLQFLAESHGYSTALGPAATRK